MKLSQNVATNQEPQMLSGWRLVLSKLFLIRQRYVFAIMSLLAIANAYSMRVCLNLTITQMVKKRKHTTLDARRDLTNKYDDISMMKNSSAYRVSSLTDPVKFEWSEATQGLLLAAFYFGYVVTHVPGGMLAERYGGKWVLGLGLLSTAVCTLLTPIAVRAGGAVALFILRVIEGFGEGPTMPGLMAMISRWAPKEERGRFGALVFGGAQIGNIAGVYFSGLVLHKTHIWDNVFYLFGVVGMVWFVVWTLICYSTPNTHPFITIKEKKFLNENVESLIKAAQQKTLDAVPWGALIRSVPLWALIIAAIGHDWGYFTMVTDLPKYMTDVLKFNIKKAGIWAAVPYAAMWVSSFLFGFLCDFLIKRGIHSIKNARKIYTTIAATGPGICIILASYSGLNTTLAVFWFIMAMTLMGAYYCGMKVNPLDISPNFCGTTTSLVNGIAAISAIITPYLIGLLTPDSSLTQWRIAFWVCFAVLIITNVVYIIYAQGRQEWWDDVKKHGYPENWKHGNLPQRKQKKYAEESDQTK